MELTTQTIKQIAELARLELSEEELNFYKQDLQKILTAFEDLQSISLPAELEGDARSALLLKQVQNSSEEISRFAADTAQNSLSSQNFLAQTPEREGVFVRVPAILNSTT